MVVIIKKRGETKENLFRKFTRSFIEEDIVKEIRDKMFYKKPSLMRKIKEKERLQKRSKRRLPTRSFSNRSFSNR